MCRRGCTILSRAAHLDKERDAHGNAIWNVIYGNNEIFASAVQSVNLKQTYFALATFMIEHALAHKSTPSFLSGLTCEHFCALLVATDPLPPNLNSYPAEARKISFLSTTEMFDVEAGRLRWKRESEFFAATKVNKDKGPRPAVWPVAVSDNTHTHTYTHKTKISMILGMNDVDIR